MIQHHNIIIDQHRLYNLYLYYKLIRMYDIRTTYSSPPCTKPQSKPLVCTSPPAYASPLQLSEQSALRHQGAGNWEVGPRLAAIGAHNAIQCQCNVHLGASVYAPVIGNDSMPLVPVHMTAGTTVLTLLSTHQPTQYIIFFIVFAIFVIIYFDIGTSLGTCRTFFSIANQNLYLTLRSSKFDLQDEGKG